MREGEGDRRYLCTPSAHAHSEIWFETSKVAAVASQSDEQQESQNDPRAVDALLSELVVLLSRSSLYFRFLKKHVEVRRVNSRKKLCPATA